jgi:cardiolipin synthase
VALRGPEVVFHLGWLPPGHTQPAVLARGLHSTLNVLEAARLHGVAKVVTTLPAVALYFMFGETVMAKRRAKRYAAMHATAPGSDPATVLAPALTASQGAVATVAERLGGSAALGGNCVEFLADAVEFEKQLIAAIDGAKHHVHAVYFIFEDDEVGRRVASANSARSSGPTVSGNWPSNTFA